jgi:hypothetical protein
MDNNNGFPLKLVCHVSPYLLPEKHSSQFLQVEQNVILETMLPKIEGGFYDDQRQAPVECKKGDLVPSKRNVLLSCSRDYTATDHVKSIPDGKFYRPYQQEEAEEEIPRYVKVISDRSHQVMHLQTQ